MAHMADQHTWKLATVTEPSLPDSKVAALQANTLYWARVAAYLKRNMLPPKSKEAH